MFRFIYVFFLVSLLFLSSVFAGLSNSFKFSVASGTMLKYYCPASINVIADYGSDTFQSFENNVKFDNSFLSLTHSSVSSIFSANSTGYITNDIYSSAGRAASVQSADIVTNTFSIVTSNTNNSSTDLKFVSSTGLILVYGASETNDKTNLREPNGTYDTIIGTTDTTYNFEAYPCVDDSRAPIVYNNQLNSPAIGTHFLGTGVMSGLVVDWYDVDNNGIADYHHYRYGGTTPLSISNYTSAPNDVDAQYGVDRSTLSVKIDNTNTSSGYIEYPSLTITDYVGGENPNQYTWNSERRGYYLAFKNANNNIFEIEKPVHVTITGFDNLNHSGARHLMTKTFSFNPISLPVLSPISPADGSSFINPSTSFIKFSVTDSWAGVDTGKVWITIPEVFSGGISVMSGHTYTSLDMAFSGIFGAPLLGNSGGYDVVIQLDSVQQPLAADSQIRITGLVVDLAGNTGLLNLGSWDFTTRPDCSFYGCNEILDVYIMGGSYSNGGLPYLFTGQLLVATGTNPNSPYPYITGASNNILMCGFGWTGAVLDGNVDVVDSVGVSITGSIYTQNKLYVTGLDFVYDPNTGIITIN